jgi:hypothetical protein
MCSCKRRRRQPLLKQPRRPSRRSAAPRPTTPHAR